MEIREQLNRQLENGALGKDMAAWLNGLPEVHCILAELFGGRPVSAQNVSVWLQGGYQDWLFRRDGRLQMRELMDEARELGQAGAGKDGTEPSRHLGTIMVVELAHGLRRLHETRNPKKRWALLRALSLELSRLRLCECREKSLRLKQLKAERRWSKKTLSLIKANPGE
jgi:hypothetical protein